MKTKPIRFGPTATLSSPSLIYDLIAELVSMFPISRTNQAQAVMNERDAI